jgi:hypothetical protein
MAGCEDNAPLSGLRMRQKDDADEVEKACYKSHRVFVIPQDSSSVVGW